MTVFKADNAVASIDLGGGRSITLQLSGFELKCKDGGLVELTGTSVWWKQITMLADDEAMSDEPNQETWRDRPPLL